MAKKRKGAEKTREEIQPKNGETPVQVAAPEEDLFPAGLSWYVVHTYSGYEDKVRTNLEQRIKSMEA